MSKILKIEDQYKFNVRVLMHKLKNNKLPSSFDTIRYFTTTTSQVSQIVEWTNPNESWYYITEYMYIQKGN